MTDPRPIAYLTGDYPKVSHTFILREVEAVRAAGVPVIPIAQWGPQDVMGPYVKEFKLIPRKQMHMRVGPPVELDDLRGLEMTSEVLATATTRIMDEILAVYLAENLRTPPVLKT